MLYTKSIQTKQAVSEMKEGDLVTVKADLLKDWKIWQGNCPNTLDGVVVKMFENGKISVRIKHRKLNRVFHFTKEDII